MGGWWSKCTDCAVGNTVVPGKEMTFVPQPPEVNAKLHFGWNYTESTMPMDTPQKHRDMVKEYKAWQEKKNFTYPAKGQFDRNSKSDQDACIEWWVERLAAYRAEQAELAPVVRRIDTSQSLVF